MIQYLDVAEAPTFVDQFVEMFHTVGDFLYLTQQGIPHIVVVPMDMTTRLPLTETDTAPRKLAALVDVVEKQGKPLVLSCGDQPLLALVPYRGGIGRAELAAYRKNLREQAIYMRCVGEWGYDPDHDDGV